MRQSPRHNIIACTEDGGARPPTLREVGTGRLAGREVAGWMDHFGSYGMGGPGFFELSLAASAQFPREHLVLRLWGAANWLLLDGRWLSAHPNQYGRQRPLFSAFAFGGDERWDDATTRLVGTTITDAKIAEHESIFRLVRGADEHTLELPRDTARLPWHGGSLEPRRWHPDESHPDAWVVTQSDLYC